MPNRIIKESICTSETVAQLSDFEFRLWIGLITQADDAGRCDARAAIIKGHVFPLRERVTIKDIDNALHALADRDALLCAICLTYSWSSLFRACGTERIGHSLCGVCFTVYTELSAL